MIIRVYAPIIFPHLNHSPPFHPLFTTTNTTLHPPTSHYHLLDIAFPNTISTTSSTVSTNAQQPRLLPVLPSTLCILPLPPAGPSSSFRPTLNLVQGEQFYPLEEGSGRSWVGAGVNIWRRRRRKSSSNSNSRRSRGKRRRRKRRQR